MLHAPANKASRSPPTILVQFTLTMPVSLASRERCWRRLAGLLQWRFYTSPGTELFASARTPASIAGLQELNQLFLELF